MQFNCRKVCDEGNILEGVMQHPLFLAIVAGEAAMQVCRWRSWGRGEADVVRPLILPGHRICLRTCGGESSRGSFMTLWEDDTWSAMGWQRN